MSERGERGPSVRPSHVGLCVADLDRAMRLYTEGLGFTVGPGYDLTDVVAGAGEVLPGVSGRSQMLVHGGVTVELLWWESPGAHGTPSTTRNQLGLTHLSFEVDDIAAVEARLVDLGATVIESSRTHIDVGGSTTDLLFLADPEGNRIELMAHGLVD